MKPFAFLRGLPRALRISICNIVGLLFSVAGVVLLFRYALPVEAPLAPKYLGLYPDGPGWEAAKAHYDNLALIGLGLVLIGTLLEAVPPICSAAGGWRRRARLQTRNVSAPAAQDRPADPPKPKPEPLPPLKTGNGAEHRAGSPEPAVTDQERYEANLRAAERAHDRADAASQQVNEAAVRDAQAAIGIVLILNGGAVIAVLAFVGSLATKGTSQLPLFHEVISHSFWFVLGAASTGIVAALAYLTNVCYGASWAYLERAWAHPYLRNTRKATWFGRAGWFSIFSPFWVFWPVWVSS